MSVTVHIGVNAGASIVLGFDARSCAAAKMISAGCMGRMANANRSLKGTVRAGRSCCETLVRITIRM